MGEGLGGVGSGLLIHTYTQTQTQHTTWWIDGRADRINDHNSCAYGSTPCRQGAGSYICIMVRPI